MVAPTSKTTSILISPACRRRCHRALTTNLIGVTLADYHVAAVTVVLSLHS